MTKRRRPQTVSDAPDELDVLEYAALREAVGEGYYQINQYDDGRKAFSGWYYIFGNHLVNYRTMWFVKDPKGGYWCGYSGRNGVAPTNDFYGDTPAEAVLSALAAQRLGVGL